MTDPDDVPADAFVSVDAVTGGGFEARLGDEEIAEHLATAHLIVSEQLLNEGLSDDRLARIELFLTRHLIRFGPDRQTTGDTTGPLSMQYTGDFDGRELEATAPGQQVLMLDTSNTLGQETTFEFFSVG